MVEENQKEFLTAKYDRIYKAIFQNPEYPNMTKKMLEYLLPIQVDNLRLLGNELLVSNKDEKAMMVDGLILLNKHHYIHIEVNTNSSEAINRRNFLSFTNIYGKNVRRGEAIDMEDNFIHIDINYGMGKTKEPYYCYKVRDEKGNTYIKNVEIYAYNMDRIKEFWYTKDIENIKKYKYLIMLDLNREELEELNKIIEGDEVIMEYTNMVTRLNSEERYRPLFTMEEKQKINENILRREAFEEGEAQGEARGERLGMTAEKNNVARNMLNKGLDIGLVSEITGLSEKAIQRLSI